MYIKNYVLHSFTRKCLTKYIPSFPFTSIIEDSIRLILPAWANERMKENTKKYVCLTNILNQLTKLSNIARDIYCISSSMPWENKNGSAGGGQSSTSLWKKNHIFTRFPNYYVLCVRTKYTIYKTKWNQGEELIWELRTCFFWYYIG